MADVVNDRGIPRRTMLRAAAWSAPVITAAIAVPLASASGEPSIEFGGVPAEVAVGDTVADAQVVAADNAGLEVTVTLPAGFVWADGGSETRTVGTGPGTFAIPAFIAASASSGGSLTAATGGVSASAPIDATAAYTMTGLGGMNVITDGPDEFRADLAILVPKGVRPTGLYYNYFPTTANATTALARQGGDNSAAVRDSVGEAYGILTVQTVGSAHERLFIHARGDSDIGAIATQELTWILRATWSGHADTTVTLPLLNVDRRPSVGRPVAVNAWDSTTNGLPGYIGPNAQAGWGNSVPVSGGPLTANVFHLDSLNSGRAAAIGNDQTVTVYYQFVHEDGAAAAITPEPRPVTVPNHASGVAGVLLGTADPSLGGTITLDKPGYWKLLIWPQSSNSQPANPATPGGVAWNPQGDPGAQVGSVFWMIPTAI
ncbi:hypothetical protein [Microbacterium sp. NPDC057650]|uniref:hypothetical protein n=1 Tax=unclassified Microbacterium TaxID=2609290 RepID=UPI00366C005F